MTDLAQTNRSPDDDRRDSFTVARRAFDPRADRQERTVHMSLTQVSIERVLCGIKMALAVPVASYDAVKIRVSAPSGAATVTLSHKADRDLDVVLAAGRAEDVTIAAKAWSVVLGKTVVVEAGLSIRPAQPRSAKPAKPAFVRHVGDARRMVVRFAGEREIIARS